MTTQRRSLDLSDLPPLRQFDFTLAGLDSDTLNVRYLCHHHGEQYLRATPARRIVTTGFGMSGLRTWPLCLR